MYNGMLAVCKEKGLTSHDVVNRMRRILGQKKIGHTGTLDPMAEGVLPVCLGNGTKLTPIFVGDDKQYRAVIRLGVRTDTQDMTGEIIETSDRMPEEKRIHEVVSSFEGEQWQMPPMYSAVKINGKRLYQYARSGVEVEREKRKIRILSIRIEEILLPFVTIVVDCSKGTYIRTLCEDIGKQLGCFGALAQLTRTRSGDFHLADCITLEQMKSLHADGMLTPYIRTPDTFFPDAGRAVIKPEVSLRLRNGNPLTGEDLAVLETGRDKRHIRVYDETGVFTGLYKRAGSGALYRAEKMFL